MADNAAQRTLDGDVRTTSHIITVTLDQPGRFSVECACGRLATYAHDEDLGITIKVHLEAEASDDDVESPECLACGVPCGPTSTTPATPAAQ